MGKLKVNGLFFYGSCVLLLIIVVDVDVVVIVDDVLLKSIIKVDFGLWFLKWLVFYCLVNFN